MFAGEVRRVEDEVAHHAASQEDAGLVELANDGTFGDLKDELKSLIHVVLLQVCAECRKRSEMTESQEHCNCRPRLLL